ncbi:MAG: 1-acyl-sn-glycerol-3-phosphate acyltransferase [Candidatus Omnitrophica bacterium]|nr:1-acyl-sn-glycerol-3-phosphate acyltransferase [Candidatus Omnitrophota bacterium]
MSDLVRIIFFVLIVRPLLVFFIGLRVRGREHWPLEHPFIVIANHTSHLDAAALLAFFPLKDLRRVRPVAAADYFNSNKCIAFFSRIFFNILPIARKNIGRHQNPLDGLREALEHKETLIIFPEGTRSSSGEMGPFHTGIAHILKEFPQVPVIPVYMSNMYKALPKGEFILVPFICEVNIGKPLFLSGTKDEIVQTLRDSVIKLKGEAEW